MSRGETSGSSSLFAATNRRAVGIGIVCGIAISVAIALFKLAPLGASHAVLAAAIATPYLAFAAHDGRPSAFLAEAAVVTVFFVAALVLLDGSVYAIAAVLALHGAWDALHVHGRICTVVRWWPPWCAALDVTAGVTLIVVHTWMS